MSSLLCRHGITQVRCWHELEYHFRKVIPKKKKTVREILFSNLTFAYMEEKTYIFIS